MTDSVDFKITDNGSVSFMTNVSARFWVVQIINESDTGLVESLASDVYKEAIKVPYLATFAIRWVYKLISSQIGTSTCVQFCTIPAISTT